MGSASSHLLSGNNSGHAIHLHVSLFPNSRYIKFSTGQSDDAQLLANQLQAWQFVTYVTCILSSDRPRRPVRDLCELIV